MASSGMLRLVTLVRTDVSKGPITSIFRVTVTGGLGTLAGLAITVSVAPSSPILFTMMMKIYS
jgi:hypothetical protein